MDWTNWQTYAAPLIVMVTLGMFLWRWKKASDAKCCGGRCGCAVSKRNKRSKQLQVSGLSRPPNQER